MISLQFITHRTERYSYFESARMALEGGCKWIQLRMKDAPLDEVEAVALQLKPLCYLRLLTLEPGRAKAEYRAKTQKKQPPRRALLRRELWWCRPTVVCAVV